MIWSADEIVSELSKQYRLVASDLIYTGTPAGVGPLVAGDKIDASIDGVGSISVTINAPLSLTAT